MIRSGVAMGIVLVTGGAGYIGSSLVPGLLANGQSVRIVDSFLYVDGALAGLASDPRVTVVAGDIRDRESMWRAIDGVDGVVHLAAIVGDPACELRPGLATTTNLEATALL